MEIHGYKPSFSPEKFRELMLYAAERSTADERFGAIKLNKILFFSDFLSYGLTGEPITGATYQRLRNGPAPVQLGAMEKEIVRDRDGYLLRRPYFNRTQQVLVAARPANRNRFSVEELDLVNDVIQALAPHNATEASDLSHDRSFAWQVAEEGEEIPYTAVFLSSHHATPTDIDRGRELARKYGWLSPAL